MISASPIMRMVGGGIFVITGLTWVGSFAGSGTPLTFIGVLLMMFGLYLGMSGLAGVGKKINDAIRDEDPADETYEEVVSDAVGGGYCPNCGSPVGADFKHCRVCGRRIK